MRDRVHSTRRLRRRKYRSHRKSCRRKRSNIRHPADQNLIVSFMASVVFVSISLTIGSPIMIVLTVLMAVISSLRYLSSICILSCKKGCDDRCQYLTPQEILWFQDPTAIVHTVMILEKRISWMQLKQILFTRILDARLPHDDNVLRYPRFSQKVVRSFSRSFWYHDVDFDLNNHIFNASFPLKTDENISKFLSMSASEPLSMHRPLWEIYISTEYGKNQDDTVLILRTHSCLTDGISFIKILVNSLADFCGGFKLKPRFGGESFPFNIFRALIVGPLTFLLWLLCKSKDRNILRGPGFELSGQKTMLFSKNLSLLKVRRIKQVTRCHYNDVLLSLVAGSVRNYFRTHGVKSPDPINVNIPVDLRPESQNCNRISADMGMKMSMMNVSLPANVEGTIPRLWNVHRTMEDLKNSADSVVMYGALYYLYGLLPQSLAFWILELIYKKQTMQVVNIPGPEVTLYVDNHRLMSVLYWAPSIVKSIPMSLSLLTYGESVRLTVSADTGAVPDAQCIIDEFISLIDVVSKLLANRRIPGEHRKKSFSSAHHQENEIAKVHPIEDLQKRLHDVQEELQDITNKIEATTPDGTAFQELSSTHKILSKRMEELKRQFSVVLEELRRRKSLAEGVELSDGEESLDGPLRRPKKRALSTPNVWKQATTAPINSPYGTNSTSRPLAIST